MLKKWHKYATNCQIASAPQYGKTKAAEYFMRRHVKESNPFTLMDYHGPLYRDMVRYLTLRPSTLPVLILNFSKPKFITPFNPFRYRGGSVSAYASRLSNVVVKAWGEENTDRTPRLERIMKMLFTFCAYTGEPLHHAVKLLEYHQRVLRQYAISVIKDDTIREYWKELQHFSLSPNNPSHYRAFLDQVESTRHRLQRFVESEPIKLFMGLPDGIDIDDLWAQKAIVLVNIAPSEYLSKEAARTVAAVLLASFDRAARKRMTRPQAHYLYLDECQEYLSPDAAPMIDQLLKSGLRMTFIHHHSGEFHDSPHLLQSFRYGAQIKLAFGGLTPDQAKITAEEFFMPELNRRWKKEDKVHYLTQYDDEPYEEITETHTISQHEGMVGEEETGGVTEINGQSIRHASQLIPRIERVVDGQEDFNREDKLSMLAQRLMELKKRECYLKFPGKPARKRRVPRVRPVLLTRDTVLEFIQESQTKAISKTDAERVLEIQERNFLERSVQVESGSRRPKKRPATLHQQG